jgi:hypothetical protein
MTSRPWIIVAEDIGAIIPPHNFERPAIGGVFVRSNARWIIRDIRKTATHDELIADRLPCGVLVEKGEMV